MAAMAGRNTLDVPPMSAWAAITGQNVGKNAISNAPAARATTAAAMIARLERRRSTSPPAGVCVTMPAMPPTVRARPTLCSFHL